MINTVILHNHKWITSQQEGHELEQLTGYDFDIHEQVRVYVDRKNKNYWMWCDIADGVRKNFVVALEEEALLLNVDKHCCFCRRADNFIAFVVRSKLRVKNISFCCVDS